MPKVGVVGFSMALLISAVCTGAGELYHMLCERKVMSTCNEAQYVFEGVVFDLDYLATLLADDMVMVRLEWLGELGERRPAMDCCLGNAEFGKKLQCPVDAGAIDRWRALGDFSVFEWFVCSEQRFKDGFARCGDTQAVRFEDF